MPFRKLRIAGTGDGMHFRLQESDSKPLFGT